MTRSTRSTTELLQIGLEATTFVLIRQMLSVAFEAVEVFGLSTARILATSTPGPPFALRIVTVNQATSGRFLCFSVGDFGSLFVFFTRRLRVAFGCFFFLPFPRFLTIFGATFEKKYKCCDAAESSGA